MRLYNTCMLIYTCFYFYFFPFIVIAFPVYAIVFKNDEFFDHLNKGPIKAAGQVSNNVTKPVLNSTKTAKVAAVAAANATKVAAVKVAAAAKPVAIAAANKT